MTDRKQGPLAGIRVLDFSTLLPGPLATLMLAEAGAEVIKIERPDGEDMRRFEPKWGEESVSFALLNRGKKSVAADLKDPKVRDRILALAKTADVVVEQFRPGVMDRLGLGYSAFRAANPRIVYCAITGYGQTGPRRDRAGHDLNYIGDAGLLALSSGQPGHRVVPPALTADIAGASYPAVMNILLALRQRETTGEGTFIDVSMAECVFPFMFWALGAGFATGQWPGDGTDLLTGGSPRYRLYETRDGKVAAVAAIEQRFWTSFCAAIGLEPDLIDDERDKAATIFARHRHHRRQNRRRMAADLRQGRLLLLDHAGPARGARRSALQGARPVRGAAHKCGRPGDPGSAGADHAAAAAGRDGRRVIARARRA